MSLFSNESFAGYRPDAVSRACTAWLEVKAQQFEAEKTRRLQEIMSRRRWFSTNSCSKAEASAILRREDPFFEMTLESDKCEHIRHLKNLAETTTDAVVYLCAKDAHRLAKFLGLRT